MGEQQKQEKWHQITKYFQLLQDAAASVIKLLGHYLHEKVHKMCTSSTKKFFFPPTILSSQ